MAIGNFKSRLTALEFRCSSSPSDEEKAALNEIITYLDSLAARKVSGDPYVQQEIEDCCSFLASKGQTKSAIFKS
jgi:hypothetical protein